MDADLGIKDPRFKAAEKLSYSEYYEQDGPSLFWGRPFEDFQELQQFCDAEGVSLPRWAWACVPVQFLLDAEEVLATGRDRHDRPIRELLSTEQVEAFQTHLDDWAMNLDLDSYEVDYTRVVILDKSLFEELQHVPPKSE